MTTYLVEHHDTITHTTVDRPIEGIPLHDGLTFAEAEADAQAWATKPHRYAIIVGYTKSGYKISEVTVTNTMVASGQRPA